MPQVSLGQKGVNQVGKANGLRKIKEKATSQWHVPDQQDETPPRLSAWFSEKVEALEIEIGLAESGGRASGHSLEVSSGGRTKTSYSLILHSRRFPAGRSEFPPPGQSERLQSCQDAIGGFTCHECVTRSHGGFTLQALPPSPPPTPRHTRTPLQPHP